MPKARSVLAALTILEFVSSTHPLKNKEINSRHVPVRLRRELGQAGVPFGLHGGDGFISAGAIENALLSTISFIEIPCRDVEKAAVAAGKPVLSPGWLALCHL